MNISTGIRQPHGIRAVIYGVEGIGKTTLASKLESPLFIDLVYHFDQKFRILIHKVARL